MSLHEVAVAVPTGVIQQESGRFRSAVVSSESGEVFPVVFVVLRDHVFFGFANLHAVIADHPGYVLRDIILESLVGDFVVPKLKNCVVESRSWFYGLNRLDETDDVLGSLTRQHRYLPEVMQQSGQ